MTPNGPADRLLVEQARAGDQEKLGTMAGLVRERVYPYLRRVTLNEHTAEDLAQETAMAVIRSLDKLKQEDRFWPWAFAIATNLVRPHFRRSRHRTTSLSSVEESQLAVHSKEPDGLAAACSRELAEVTHRAMDRVGERYRAILSLRFYEDMSHAQIAEVLGCSELTARALFFRAKHAIRRELKRLGIGRTAWVAALLAFGKITMTPASASAGTVSLPAGAAAESIIAKLLSRKIEAIVAALLLLFVLGGWLLANNRRGATPAQVAGTLTPTMSSAQATLAPQPSSKLQTTDTAPLYVHAVVRGDTIAAVWGGDALHEFWIYFPRGVNGPHIERKQPMSEQDRARLKWYVQTEDANYRFAPNLHELHIDNKRFVCNALHTAVLPTDSQRFSAFVHAIEKGPSHAMVDKEGFMFQRDPVTGFVIGITDMRSADSPPARFTVEYNPPMQENPLAFTPPAGMKLVDDRDAMRRRGWTHFDLSGHFGSNPIVGKGRVPFTYAASLTHPAWLQMKIGDEFLLSDDGNQAVVQNRSGTLLTRGNGGAFLRGMSRPWEGFHTLDTVRRDAASSECVYSTEGSEHDSAFVRMLWSRLNATNVAAGSAEFIIDMQRDLLESSRFQRIEDSEPLIELKFAYLDNPNESLTEPFPQAITSGATISLRSDSPFWPLEVFTNIGARTR